jgi:hypothetical protein
VEIKEIHELKQEDIPEEGLEVQFVAFHHLPSDKIIKSGDTCKIRRKENPKSSAYHNDRIVYHDCDSNGMASGGALLHQGKVVALHKGNVIPVKPDGSIRFENPSLSIPEGWHDMGMKESPTYDLKFDPQGSPYNELTHAGQAILIWEGDPSAESPSDRVGPADYWRALMKGKTLEDIAPPNL